MFRLSLKETLLGMELLADDVFFLRQLRNDLRLGSSNDNRQNARGTAEEFPLSVGISASSGSLVLLSLSSAEVGAIRAFFLTVDLSSPPISGDAVDPMESMTDDVSGGLRLSLHILSSLSGRQSSCGSSSRFFFL